MGGARRGARLGRRGFQLAGACLLAALLGPAGVAGQQEEPPVDSTRIRQLQLLRDLSRAPGADSARLAEDSARLAGPDRSFEGGRAPRSASDSIMAELLTLAGYSPTEYLGASAEYRADEGMLYLYGDSTVRALFRGQGYESSTDSLVAYDEETGQLEMWGDVISIPVEGDEIQSRYLACDIADDSCRAARARTQFTQGGDWIVTGDLPEIRSDVSYAHGASFTSCELEVPHYHFETDQIKIVNGNIMVAKPVRLYFADVPVAWLPFIAQSLGDGRASGLLTPTFSVNDIVRTSGGYQRRISNVGFYWAINDYMDGSVALDWWDSNYTAVTGSYRYLWSRQFLQGSLNFRRFWRAEGGAELTLNTRSNWDLSERTNFRVSASYASSSSFVTENSFNPQEITQSIDSDGGVTHRFDWGTLAVNGNRRQFLTDDRVETTFPSASLSLRSITLFPAPVARAGVFNNLTWSGSANLSRSTVDLAEQPVYDRSQLDRANLRGGVSTSLNLGNLSVSGSANYREGTTVGLRDSIPTTLPQQLEEQGMLAFDSDGGQAWLRMQTTDPDA
ncbi:MAG TPA: putative LPS assembly protein LptD, partial [Longimicrobiales bacterium]|nr:putative LPS assembly protein LptD [Longimicrobiales bacterium]